MLKKTTQNGRIKLLSEPGEFSAVFATLGVVDLDGDVIEPGAFTQGQAVRVSSWGHKWQELPVGRGRIWERGNEAVCEGRLFMDTGGGRETYATIKGLGELQEWSFGYDVLDSAPGDVDGQRVQLLRRLNVYEVSPVMIAAGIATRTTAIKSAGGRRLTPRAARREIEALQLQVTPEDVQRLFLSEVGPAAVLGLVKGLAPTNADAIRERLWARYPDQSEAWIETMVRCELESIAQQLYRQAEGRGGAVPSYGRALEQALAWAGSPAG